MKEELLKQWQQDVEDYGDQAYKMWESQDGYKTFKNYDVLPLINNDFAIKRKQSAELPFDLDNAKNGDGLQCLMTIHRTPFDCKFVKETNVSDLYEIKINDTLLYFWNVDLQMKYPPKVNK